MPENNEPTSSHITPDLVGIGPTEVYGLDLRVLGVIGCFVRLSLLRFWPKPLLVQNSIAFVDASPAKRYFTVTNQATQIVFSIFRHLTSSSCCQHLRPLSRQ